MKKNYN